MAMIEKIDNLMIVMREPGIVPLPEQVLGAGGKPKKYKHVRARRQGTDAAVVILTSEASAFALLSQAKQSEQRR
jgi:hypothetical protein